MSKDAHYPRRMRLAIVVTLAIASWSLVGLVAEITIRMPQAHHAIHLAGL